MGEVKARQKWVAIDGWSERVLEGKVMGRFGVWLGDLPDSDRRSPQYLPESCPREHCSTVETQARRLDSAISPATCCSRLPRFGWVGLAERRESRCRTRARARSDSLGMNWGRFPWGMEWAAAFRRTFRKTTSPASHEPGRGSWAKSASVSLR